MKNSRPTLSLSVWIFVLSKLLFYGILIVSGIGAVLLFQLKDKHQSTAAGVAAAIVLFTGICLSFFTVPEVINRMKADQTLFLRAAIAQTFTAYLMLASFLPIVGSLFSRFVRSEKRKDPFTDDNG